MKICYISSTFFSDSDLGVLKDISRENEVCYGVVIPCKNNNYSVEQLDDTINGCNKTLIKKEVFAKGRLRNPLNIISYFKWLRSLHIDQYDVVYVNNTEDIFLSLLLILFIRNKPLIYGVHDAVNHSGWQKSVAKTKANEMMISRATSLLAFSESQSDILKTFYPNKKVFTIPLALKDFGNASKSSLNYDVINFLFFGNIASYKGLDLLLKAVDVLSKKYNNFTLTVAGRCAEWETEYGLLINSGMRVETHIRFIDNSEISHFFSNAHYLVLPYRDVTQSGPLMIGYNYNLPVLASRLKGFEEFLEEGVSGYFFQADNVDSLINTMETAILKSKEEYLLLRNTTGAFAKANFGVEKMAAKYMDMFYQMATRNEMGQIAYQ